MNLTEAEVTSETASFKSEGPLNSMFGIDSAGKTYSTNYYLVTTLIAAILSTIQLSIGATYNGQCPINQRISTYMIVTGSVDLVNCAISFFFILTFRYLVSHSVTLPVLASCGLRCNLFLSIVLSIFSFIWLIIGCVWVFGVAADVQFTFLLKPDYCQPVLYKATFAFLIISIIWYVIQICVSCFLMRRGGRK